MKNTLLIVMTACLTLLSACASADLPGATAGPSPEPLTQTDLKYALLAKFPDFFFCDPDYYPIARAIDPAQLAQQNLPQVEADAEVFQSILRHNGLAGLTTLTDQQKILIYTDFKKLRAIQLEPSAGGYSFAIQSSSGKGAGTLNSGTIDPSGDITVQSQTPTFATCPICLSAQTRIDTPRGPVPVTDLKVGDLVWTLDGRGERVAEPVLQVGSTPVPPTHQMVHLVLSDGRELWASPGHPTTDGRHLGDLAVGEVFDGARVTTAQLVPYGQTATYDLLPAGGTGYYWANGILLASTLAHP